MPQPIDPYTEVARVHAAERIQQIADRASLAAQQRAQATKQQQHVDAETLVQEAEQKSEQVDRELRRRNPYLGRRRRKRGQDSDSDAEGGEHKRPPADLEDHQLDVTV
ncbi:MAG TPA: hypothetical protein PKI11_02205 [Candidatus Hydrogenedentes bacterium]|nr:hypothetical protein [Candidatus Hydrogenedentota bacterium]